MTETATALVRQHAPRGDERRTALLTALDTILTECAGELDAVNIADISRRAGVTRSAFYFYFDNAALAVAALMEEHYDEVHATADQLGGDLPARETIEATIRSLFAAWEQHQHLYRAMLDARAASTEVRQRWEADRETFVPYLAATITDERTAGRAVQGTDATALASVLLELNDRTLERLTLGGPLDRDQLIDTVVHIWMHSIYGGLR